MLLETPDLRLVIAMLLSSNGSRTPATMFVDVSLLPVRGCPTSFSEETSVSILSGRAELKPSADYAD